MWLTVNIDNVSLYDLHYCFALIKIHLASLANLGASPHPNYLVKRSGSWKHFAQVLTSNKKGLILYFSPMLVSTRYEQLKGRKDLFWFLVANSFPYHCGRMLYSRVAHTTVARSGVKGMRVNKTVSAFIPSLTPANGIVLPSLWASLSCFSHLHRNRCLS